MDLTAIGQATEAEEKQGLVEWPEAFRADNWEKVKDIDNSAVKEAAKTMELTIEHRVLISGDPIQASSKG